VGTWPLASGVMVDGGHPLDRCVAVEAEVDGVDIEGKTGRVCNGPG
jgi:hypothetical protein